METTINTKVIKGQEYYIIPQDLLPSISVEVFNRKKNTWDKRTFDIVIRIPKKLKTDEDIKLKIKTE